MTTTSALPVTSKPIESTAENLAWQAWLMLPPEQKQLIKSRKVTPKSIFTLPLRVECPEGHQQIDNKCIPTVTGSNAVLIHPNVLGLVLGDAPTADVEYDYEDEPIMGDGNDYNPPLYLTAGTDGKSNTETILELKPPSQDEPLKFNIFQHKFPTDDYPMEDYSGISNEGSAQAPVSPPEVKLEQEGEQNKLVVNVTGNKDLVGEASNVSKTHSLNHITESNDFNLENLEAISVPATAQGQDQKPHTISLFNEDSAIHLVTTAMDTEEEREEEKNVKGGEEGEGNAKPQNLETLLQTESLMPMLNHTTASTLVQLESLPLIVTNTSELEELDNSPSLQIENVEEITTILPDPMDSRSTLADTMEEQKQKTEFIRSVTMNPLYDEDNNREEEEDQDVDMTTTTLTSSKANEDSALETTTMDSSSTIQLDDTTIIEGNFEITTMPPQEQETESLPSSSTTTETTSATPMSSSSTTSSSFISSTLPSENAQQLLEPSDQDFEELQKDQQQQQRDIMQKSKVEPVEVLATRTTTARPAVTTTTTTTTSGAMPKQPETMTTTTADELITTTTSGEPVTPLLTVHNNGNDNIDNTNSNNNNVKSSTSEIDLAEELRLINELVKGKRPAITLTAAEATTLKTTTTTTTTATTTSQNDDVDNEIHTSPKPSTASASVTPVTVSVPSSAASPLPSPSESSASSIKYRLETTKIWSKIMPLIKTTTTTTTEKSPEVSGNLKTSESTTTNGNDEESSSTMSSISSSTSDTQTESTTPNAARLVVSNRSHRNSKIIRINGLNSLDFKQGKKTTATTTEDISPTTEEFSTTTTTEASASSSPKPLDEEEETDAGEENDDNAYGPFWWLPISWRLDGSASSKDSEASSTTSTTIKPDSETSIQQQQEDMPLLLRFWSTYHAPKSS
ncbi:protein folded gastrulation [Musca vetustissima]|uniref:protein folded gastrulation n=1 Tax=Musca vetustissima TaxID=27455 RepID=UPI002AB6378E|nr:protein folded gastrulation [Musca vetustissima]